MTEVKKETSTPTIHITCPTGGSVPPTFHVRGTADLGRPPVHGGATVTCELYYNPSVSPPVRLTGIGINQSGCWSCYFQNVPLPVPHQTTFLGAALINDQMTPLASDGPVSVTVDSSVQDPCTGC
jgi:hypothetical protein